MRFGGCCTILLYEYIYCKTLTISAPLMLAKLTISFANIYGC